MAEDLDDGEFWLPSSFLSDDILFDDSKVSGELFPWSSLSPSPVGSVVSSTESDGEDYVAGLTQLIARTALDNDGKDAAHKKARPVEGSPQSTLCSLGSWSGRSLDSNTSRGSSNGAAAQGPSPPPTPLNQKENTWEALYAATSQAVSITTKKDGPMSHGSGLSFPRCEPFAVGLSKPWAPQKNVDYPRFPATKGCCNHSSRDFIAMQILLLKERQQQQQRTCGFPANMSGTQQVCPLSRGGPNVKDGRTAGLLPPPCPPAQRGSANNGMRAVFLSDASTRRESTGTGVFLPRRAGYPSDHIKRKTSCSTVLLPAKVVQALNLKIEGVAGVSQTAHYFGNLVRDQQDPTMDLDHRVFLAARSGFQHPQLRRRPIRPEPLPPSLGNSFRLPQEWTY